jgi:hypothetical protein
MKKYLVIFQISMTLVLNIFAFSPLSTQALGVCGSNNLLLPDPRTHICVPPVERRNAADIITRIINYLLLFAAMIAILFIILGGYKYITSQGNAESAKNGRATVLNAVIGLAIIILAYVIVSVVNNTLAGDATTAIITN